MRAQQSSLRFLTSNTYGISLGVLLTLCIYFRPDHRALSTLQHLSYQTAELDARESRSLSQSNATLLPRDTYQCSASKPCSNGACCGASGYCGYGPTYCGSGCVSDCNAVAECGQYAKIANTQCPLNTCCSQFGFCGTTTDFCGKGCQSNCILNPTPSSSGSSSSILQNKVIGYYESWSARLDCHKIAPTDLPLDALTHINFAFAYIDPGSLQVVTMDGSTPSSLFSDITNVKSIKEDLSIFVSIGGWSFSDNGTATQPLYGEIAADAGKRQTFADNLVHFMKQYGFDGLDIDWEYPGAPDRGGQETDTENYVLLLQVLRQTFDRSGNKFGLSFTAPSSYWYLRWFDLPKMIKYADWINLMSYDLHGVWDATDPIGSIVQGHTNLTEIKLATELFWRVQIPPEKIVMGFGFYGRSFTLADPGCSKPGCAFSGASNPGPCSATGGILAYYEIMNILNGATTGKKRGTISPTHDSVDAVNYFTFDNDQWVSYDDATTFKQKVDWANGVGLGGALIWASDLDDGKYTAHAGLLGRSIQSTPSLQNIDKALSAPQAVIQDLAGSNGQNCFTYKGKCVDLNDNNAITAACGAGNTAVGWDDAGCGKKNCHCGKPICCPTNSAPKNCIWRGDNNGKGAGSDCSAQCAPGEVNIKGIGSSWGGGFLNDGNTNKCGRGRKVFCCPNPDFQQVTQGCSYAGCRKSCPTGTTSIFEKGGDCFFGHKQYCCPDPVELTACHWVGGSGGKDCANAVCSSTELEIDRAQFGGSQTGGCSYGRTKAACCTVQKAPPKPASCSTNLCTALPGFCNNDNDDESANGYTKRDLALSKSSSFEHVHVLEERGGSETYRVNLGNGIFMHVIAIAYPAIGSLFGGPNAASILRQFFRLIPGYCTGPSIQTGNIGKGKKPSGLGGMQTEHPIDRQVMARFIYSSASGSLPSGAGSALPPIPQYFYSHYWDLPNAQLHARPAVGGPNGIQPLTPNDRAMEAFGSNNYPNPFMAVDSQINGAKGRIMNLHPATAINTVTNLANAAVQQDSQGAADELLQAIRVGIATFDYLRTPEAVSRWNEVRQQVRTQLAYIEADVNVPNLAAWWDAFTIDFFELVEQRAQQWARDAINAAAAPFTQAHANGRALQTYGQVIGALEEMLREINGMTLPPNTFGSIPNPQPPGGGGGS